MAGGIIPVAVGIQPTQLSGSTPDNYTLYNTDTVNAVWVGNSVSVKPNFGMRLGPLGTLNWQKTSGLAFSCVDTGVVTPVLLNVSNDVTDIVNPVDVATATAIAILAHGVPNVLTTTTLVNQIVASGGVVTVDTSGYASIVLSVVNALSGTGNIVVTCDAFETGEAFADNFTLSAPLDIASNDARAKWTLPVTNTNFRVTNLAASPSLLLKIVGTNRVVPKMQQLVNRFLPRSMSFTGAFVAGAAVILADDDGLAEDVTRYNGPFKISVTMNAAARAGGVTPQYQYAARSSAGGGALLQTLVGPLLTVNSVLDFYHPSVPVSWSAVPAAAAVGAVVGFKFTPAGGGI